MASLIVLSGGLDSMVAAYVEMAKDRDCKAVTFDYGSKHNDREYQSAIKICTNLKISLTRINLTFINQYFKSDLLKSGGAIPDGHYEATSMKKTVVPFRNGIMLAIAAGLAESLDCTEIVIGNHSGDRAIYPDCRSEFIAAIGSAIKFGTEKNIVVRSPFCEIKKHDIVKLGAENNVPLGDSYSCYKGGDLHCGQCGTCTERIEAFTLAGVPDPTEYQIA